MRRDQAFFFFFPTLIYGLISLLRYYALVPVLLVFLAVGFFVFSAGMLAVHSSNRSLSAPRCALGGLVKEAIRGCGEDCGLFCF